MARPWDPKSRHGPQSRANQTGPVSVALFVILTVSTVKDTVPNLRRFVSRNLGNGVDHLLVFLDSENPAAESFLRAHPHVTCVRTDDEWWQGHRPAQLNSRQNFNANVANPEALRGMFEWLGEPYDDKAVRATIAVRHST